MSEQASSTGTAMHVTIWQDGHSMVFTGIEGHECVALVRANTNSVETLYKIANRIAKYAKEWMDKEKEGAPK